LGRAIAEALVKRGIAVSFLRPEKVTSLEGLDAVVLGSAVYSNKMLPTMTALGYRWGDRLSALPVYLFCSGPLSANPQAVAQLPLDARILARHIGARSAKLFGGRLRMGELRPAERALMRMGGIPHGDYRDWGAALRWAGQIADDALGGVWAAAPEDPAA
jgi:menaquinone-dependent protoporphyrinogen oxidase